MINRDNPLLSFMPRMEQFKKSIDYDYVVIDDDDFFQESDSEPENEVLRIDSDLEDLLDIATDNEMENSLDEFSEMELDYSENCRRS
ncbi:hypothetical protein HHI36_019732 [Cryptolaemus montrouzieri]|uniref:Uncharacterized protein n=1 Tax=Cryptolaemus montrouzieri TaxID=559131 RepID=A0ABD2N8A2_9CUCU